MLISVLGVIITILGNVLTAFGWAIQKEAFNSIKKTAKSVFSQLKWWLGFPLIIIAQF